MKLAMKKTLIAALTMALYACPEAGSTGSTLNNNGSTNIVFNPNDATTFVGTWVDVNSTSHGFTVDSAGNITGTVLANITGSGGVLLDCNFSGTLANTITSLGNNSYQIQMQVPTGTTSSYLEYCPSYFLGSFPVVKTIGFIYQSNGCIYSQDGMSVFRTYCKQ